MTTKAQDGELAIGNFTLRRIPHLSDHFPNFQTHPNPLDNNPFFSPASEFYVNPSDIVLRHIFHDINYLTSPHDAYIRSGPRRRVYFQGSHVRAAIVTCGGLCPGMNTVLRELVVGLWDLYGVREIFGIRAGYRGFYSGEAVALNPTLVHNWHKRGGTVLETSRGGFDLHKIVDGIRDRGYNQVYIIGGDGAMRGMLDICEEITRRKLNIAVVGIPKTVDNDVGIIDRSFGFETAVEVAQKAISAAHTEAESAVNGIGLVKLMGRSSGHIALHATLSSRDVDCCLIPEMDFYLEGEGGLFEFLESRLKDPGHAVVVVAEGAGQDIIPKTEEVNVQEKDESGNPVLLDVGAWLRSELKKWWKREHGNELFTVKYIDPTYMIRAVPANAVDSMYCTFLAHSAVHGGMTGYTGFVCGLINGVYAYIPVEDVTSAKNVVNTRAHEWAWVRSITNQPDFVKP